MAKQRDKKNGSKDGCACIAEQNTRIAKAHNTTACDRGSSSLADCSREILNGRRCAALLIRNVVHEEAVDAWPGHPLRSTVGEVVGDGEGCAACPGHADQRCGSASLCNPDSSDSPESAIEQGGEQHGGELQQLGHRKDDADMRERNP